jgi:hypothetical protein
MSGPLTPVTRGLTDTRGQAASQVKRDRAFSISRSMANSSGSVRRGTPARRMPHSSAVSRPRRERSAPHLSRRPGSRDRGTAADPSRTGCAGRCSATRSWADTNSPRSRQASSARRRLRRPSRSCRWCLRTSSFRESTSGDRLLTAGQDTARPPRTGSSRSHQAARQPPARTSSVWTPSGDLPRIARI